MRTPVGLTREASDLLSILQEFRFVALDDLKSNRDAAEVDSRVAELVRAGFARVRTGRRGRQVVELTEIGRQA